MLQLQDLKTGKQFALFNTHLPFRVIEEREKQVQFIIKQMKPFFDQMPVFFTGDLNTLPNRPDMKKIPFYDGNYICQLFEQSGLKDAKELALLGHIGPLSSFSNAGEDLTPFRGTGTPGVFLDHIFASKGIQVLIHAVQTGKVDGQFPSDHFPLFIDFIVD